MVLGAGALVLSPVVPHAASVAGLAGGLFAATAAPFLWQLPREDSGLRLAAPFLLVCRAAVMATGLMRTVPMLLSKTN